MVFAMKPEIVDCAAAWKGPDLARSSDWIHHLSQSEIAELEDAVRRVRSKGIPLTRVTKADFRLPTFGATLAQILREIEDGRGFVLIRGLPIERYSEDDAGMIFWGIGAHFGRAAAQNIMGDMLGHVKDIGRDYHKDYHARAYQTAKRIPFHVDSADLVGLLCYQTSKSGGLSCVVSSVSIHNEIVKRRPDLAALLYGDFYSDARGEEAPGQAPYHAAPVFAHHAGRLWVRYGRDYFTSSQRFPDVPRLTEKHLEAMDMVDALANSDALRLDMDFRKGDMQFLNNHIVLHSRTAFEDYPEPERRRRLLRLWLVTERLSDRPPAFESRYVMMREWERNPQPMRQPEPAL